MISTKVMSLIIVGSMACLCNIETRAAHSSNSTRTNQEEQIQRYKRQVQSSQLKAGIKSQKAFELDCLTAHNKWRRQHQVGELHFDPKLTAFAQKRANFIAQSDGAEFRHPDDLPFGENLAWHSRDTKTCAELVKMWYDEVDLYDFRRQSFSPETGHFTQLVWKSTTRVGCARAFSSGPQGGIYLVCNYDPPGNFLGEAPQNVFRMAKPVGPPKAQNGEDPANSVSMTRSALSTTQPPISMVGQSNSTSLPNSNAKPARGNKKKIKKKIKINKRRKNKKRKNKKKKSTMTTMKPII